MIPSLQTLKSVKTTVEAALPPLARWYLGVSMVSKHSCTAYGLTLSLIVLSCGVRRYITSRGRRGPSRRSPSASPRGLPRTLCVLPKGRRPSRTDLQWPTANPASVRRSKPSDDILASCPQCASYWPTETTRTRRTRPTTCEHTYQWLTVIKVDKSTRVFKFAPRIYPKYPRISQSICVSHEVFAYVGKICCVFSRNFTHKFRKNIAVYLWSICVSHKIFAYIVVIYTYLKKKHLHILLKYLRISYRIRVFCRNILHV